MLTMFRKSSLTAAVSFIQPDFDPPKRLSLQGASLTGISRYGVGATARAFAAGLGRFVYYVLWLLPLYLLCLVMNGAHVAALGAHVKRVALHAPCAKNLGRFNQHTCKS